MISTILAAATQATTQPAEQAIPLAIVVVVLAVALGIAWLALRSEPQFAPERIAADEPPGLLMLNLAAAIFSLFFVQSVFALSHPSLATTKGMASLPPRQQFALTLAQYGTAFCVLIAGNIAYRRKGLQRLGFGISGIPAAVPIGIVAAVSIVPLTFLIGDGSARIWNLLHLTHPLKHQMLLVLEKAPDPVVKWLVIIAAGVVAPLFEEFAFRGHLQTFIRRITHRPWVAIVVTALLFAAIHEWWTSPPILFLAICLGYVYERTNNLWVSIFVHAIFNGLNLWATLHFASP